MENLAQNVNFITRKISSPHFSSLNSLSVDMLFSHPCVHHPNTFFYNRGDAYIHSSVIYLGKGSNCWKMNSRNCCHQFIAPLNCPSPSCPPTLVITLWGWYRKSPIELCAEGQSTDTATNFETGPQMWYTGILVLEILPSTYVASQKFFWNFPGVSASCSWTTGTGKNTPRAMLRHSGTCCDCRGNAKWTYSRKNSIGCGFQFSGLTQVYLERDLLLSMSHRTARWRVLRQVLHDFNTSSKTIIL